VEQPSRLLLLSCAELESYGRPQQRPVFFRKITMRRVLLSLAATSAILSAVAGLAPAGAMTVGTASGIQAAIEETSALDQVVYVCKHRYYSSRRVCWWRPGGYTWRPWRRWRRL
jgi:hypothetical protein